MHLFNQDNVKIKINGFYCGPDIPGKFVFIVVYQ